MVSMARPFLADPISSRKAARGRADEIKTCIACNQACLDHIFSDRAAICLVNPQAGPRDSTSPRCRRPARPSASPWSAPGPPALPARSRRRAWSPGHVFEAADEIGGQLNWARAVPGKEEFNETAALFPDPASSVST